MLRNIGNELVERRLWPIPLVAVLVLIAVPLLFMKSSDATPAPPAPAADVAAPDANGLPAGASNLLSTKEREDKSRTKNKNPFRAPAGVAEESTTSDTSKSAVTEALKKSSDSGTTVTPQGAAKNLLKTLEKATGGSKSSSPKKQSTVKGGSGTSSAPKSSKKSTQTLPMAEPIKTSKPTAQVAAVDVRYGRKAGGRLQRSVPTLQVFKAGDRAMAIFRKVKGNEAVFAISPGTIVTGSVGCDKVKGVCRTVSIPDGGYARLTAIRDDGSRIVRRLDVSIRRVASTSEAAPEALSQTAKADSTCLLDKVTSLVGNALPIKLDVC